MPAEAGAEPLTEQQARGHFAGFARHARRIGAQRARLAALRVAVAALRSGCAVPEPDRVAELTAKIGGDYEVSMDEGRLRVTLPDVFAVAGAPPETLDVACQPAGAL